MQKIIARRKGRSIEIVDKDSKEESKQYMSINKAKKRSHKIQMANGGLGRGAVEVWR